MNERRVELIKSIENIINQIKELEPFMMTSAQQHALINARTKLNNARLFIKRGRN